MKKLLALLMTLCLVTPAFAAGNETTITYIGTGTEEYELTVPATMAPGDTGTVTVNGTWASERMLTVTADSSVTMTNNIDGGTKQLAITFGGIYKVGDNNTGVMASKSISVADISNALFGTWSGVFNYTVSMGDTPAGYDIQGDSSSTSNVGTLYEDEDGSFIMATGEAYQLNAVATYSLDTPTWASSNPEVATISDDGLLTAVSYGETDITYTVGDLSDTMHLKIYEPFSVTSSNRAKVGYTGADNEVLVIPTVFEDSGTMYKVTSIGGSAFWGCSNLTSITIPDSVTSIGSWAFADCSSLTSITIPNSVTSIGGRAFADCSSLTSITIPNSVTSIGGSAFYLCYNLASITIPSSVTSIGGSAFSGCPNLTSITVAEGNTSYKFIDGVLYTYDGATLMCCPTARGRSITILDGVTSIGSGAFAYCSNLTSITIPDSVTSIGGSAFDGCTSLTSITIPDSVTYIGSDAFFTSENLTTVNYTGTEEQWSAITIRSCNNYLTSATINYNYAG